MKKTFSKNVTSVTVLCDKMGYNKNKMKAQTMIGKQISKRESFKAERGQNMVEFALLIPIFCLLVIGGIQFGLIVQQYLAVVHLTREAARHASVNASDSDSTLNAYTLSIAPASLSSSELTIGFSPAASSRVQGGELEVGVSYDLSKRLFIPKNFFGWQVPTTLPPYTVTMRIETL